MERLCTHTEKKCRGCAEPCIAEITFALFIKRTLCHRWPGEFAAATAAALACCVYTCDVRNMSFRDSFKSLQSPNLRLAWMVALAADTIQIAALPLFIEGALSLADNVLDIAVGIVLVRLLGWHWAFLPTLAAELIPGLDLFPTWTAAVWFVTRQQSGKLAGVRREPQGIDHGRWSSPPEPEILPPDPTPRGG